MVGAGKIVLLWIVGMVARGIDQGDVTGDCMDDFCNQVRVKSGGEIWLKKRNGFLVEIVSLLLCTIGVVKMKGHLPFWREFRMLCIKDRVVVDHVI